MTAQIVQLAASLTVLAAFALAQVKVLTPQAVSYMLMNACGASVLSIQAIILQQWGFALLEGVWGIVSIVALILMAVKRRLRGVATVPER